MIPMDTSPTTPTPPAAGRPLRLWPGVAAAVLVVLLRFVVPVFSSDAMGVGLIGAAAGALVIVLWWLFFSRAPWLERLMLLVVTVIAAFATRPFLHPSIDGALMGRMFFVYAIPPTLGVMFVVWAVATRGLPDWTRRVTMVVFIVAACAVWTLARTGGVMGSLSELHWRWTPTPEERLLAQTANEIVPAPAAAPVAPVPEPTVATPTTTATNTSPGYHPLPPPRPHPPRRLHWRRPRRHPARAW